MVEAETSFKKILKTYSLLLKFSIGSKGNAEYLRICLFVLMNMDLSYDLQEFEVLCIEVKGQVE